MIKQSVIDAGLESLLEEIVQFMGVEKHMVTTGIVDSEQCCMLRWRHDAQKWAKVGIVVDRASLRNKGRWCAWLKKQAIETKDELQAFLKNEGNGCFQHPSYISYYEDNGIEGW